MAKMIDPKTYAKNVLKSAGYITTKSIKGVNPQLTEFITDNASAAKDMYHQVKDYKSSIRNKVNSILGETGYEDLKQVKKNAIDDLRTGKFYNPEREEKDKDELFKSMGLSFDFDDMDFDVDEDEGKEVAQDVTTNTTVANLLGKVASTQKTSAAKSATTIVKGAKTNTAAMIAHNEKMFGQLNSSLAVINSSVVNLHRDLAVPINTHIINSTNFYNVMTNEVSGIHAELKNISTMLASRFAPTGPTARAQAGSTWKAVMGSGLPDFRAWGQHAKNKFFSDSGLDMLNGFLDPEMAKMLIKSGMSSPIALIMSYAMTGAMKNSSIGRGFNKTLGTMKGGFNHMMVKISQYAKKHAGESTLPAILASLFDIAGTGKAKMDFSKYNHGRQDWTGEDSKALKEVIPTQLARIEAAITGKQAKIFDYKSGRWKTVSDLKEKFESDRRAAIGSASSELRSEIINEFIEQDRQANAGRNVTQLTTNSRAVRNLSSTYDTLISMLVMKNKNIADFKNAAELVSFCRRQRWLGNPNSGSRDFIFDEKSIMRLARLLFSNRMGGTRGRLEGAIVGGQIANNNFISNSADEAVGLLHNGSGLDVTGGAAGIANNILNATDEYGKNIFFYLRSYYDYFNSEGNRRSTRRGRGNRADTGSQTQTEAPTSSNSRTNVRNRSTRYRVTNHRYTDYDISDDDRQVYNSDTGEYENARNPIFPTSANSRAQHTGPIDKLFDKVNGWMNDLFYGSSDTGIRASIRDHGGLIGVLKDIPSAIKDFTEDMTKKFTEWVKGTWNKFKDSEFGKNFFGEMKNTVVGFAKDTWTKAKGTASNIRGFMSGKPWAADVTGAYKGGYVRKSGMASVSEGEMIIPADQNPYYTGNMSDFTRRAVEKKNYNQWRKDGGDEDGFFGFFKNGSKNVKKPSKNKAWANLTEKQVEKIEKLREQGFTEEEIAKKLKINVGRIKKYIKRSETVSSVKQDANNVADAVQNSKFYEKASDLFNTAKEAFDRVFGNSKVVQDGKKYASEVTNVAKANLPKTASSAALGALVGGALTGSGIGLLGGMVAGAGIHIIKNSDMISNKLFGTADAEGNYSGGLLSNKVTQFVKKRLPKVAKSAAIGGVLGTLGFAPGGIFGGLAIGAGLELVSTTDKFKDIMFGKEDVNGDRNGGLMGSIRDHVVNPLIRFVKEGIGKIGGFVKEKMFNPLAKMFDPLKDWLKGKSKSIMNKIVDSAKETVKRTIGERFNALFKPLTSLVGKAGKGALKAAGKVVSAPFALVGKAADSLERHNMRLGYSSKSAQERMDYEGKEYGLLKRKFKNTGYTKWAANASDEDVLSAAYYTNGASELKKNIMGQRQNLADTITASMRNGGNMDPDKVKQIKKLFNTDKVVKNNDFSDIIAAVNDLDDETMGGETKKKVLERIMSSKGNIEKDMKKRETFDQDRTNFFKRIGLTNEKDIKKFIKEGRIQSQYDAAGIRKKTGMADIDAINAAKEKDNAAKLLREQEKDSPIDMKRNSLLESILAFVSGIAKRTGVQNSDLPKTGAGTSAVNALKNSLGISNPSVPKTSESEPEAEEGTRKTEMVNGIPVQYVYSNGQWNVDTTDASSKEAMDKMEEDRNAKNAFFTGMTSGAIFDKIKGLFSGEDEDEKKPSIFSKILSFFTGGGGSSFFGLLKSVLPSLIGTGLIAAGLTKIGEAAAGTSTDSGMRAGMDADERKKEVEGYSWVKKMFLGMDSGENILKGKDMTTYQEDDYVDKYVSEGIKERTAKNLLFSFNANSAKAISSGVSKIPIVGKAASLVNRGVGAVSRKAAEIVGNTKVGSQLVEKGGSLISKIAESGGKLVTDAKGAVVSKVKDFASNSKIFSNIKANEKIATVASKASGVISKIKSVLKKVLSGIASKLGLTVTSATDDVITKAAEEGAEQIAKKGGTKLVANLSKAVVVLQVAFIANAILEGMQAPKTKAILGILDKPTLAERALAAAVNGLNEAIPGIGGIIPTETLMSIILSLLTALGLNLFGLADKRKKAQETVDQYNAENGTTYSVSEYIRNVLGEYTVQERIVNGIKSGAKKVVDVFKGFFGGKDDDEDETSTSDETGSGTLITDATVRSNYTKLAGGSSSSAAATSTSATGSITKLTIGQRIKKFLTGSGSGIHTTQKNNYKIFGGSTIDQNGCGPASASTVLKAYGKNVGINEAANYAENGGYVAGSSGAKGTKASYFKDILGQNNIQTDYMDDQTAIDSAVSSGNPTVLLGQDKNNTSKSKSPFGPNPHYIVAQGKDKNGNIIVDDPELDKPALYNKSILKNTQLGIATKSGSASGIAGLISDAFGNFSTAVSDKLGDSTAGKIWNYMFGTSDSSSSSSEDGSSSSSSSSGTEYSDTSSMGNVEYGEKNNIFTPVTSTPNSHDANIALFNNASNGGVSKCITGKPTDSICNVLSNCVGWASGRFNQIYNILNGTSGVMKYPFACNAGNFIEKAKEFGLSYGAEPQVGAIMCWSKDGGAGHVAIVEKVLSATKVYTSESGWNCNTKFWNKTREKGSNGNWGASSAYHFRGFIYNPAVTAKANEIASANVPKLTADESKTKIWRYLKDQGFTENAIAGAMGCWQSESRNMADRVEGDYIKSYPGTAKVLASRKSFSDYTTGKLFSVYANNNPPISINKDAYKGDDGNYYAGLGLAQWTGPRAKALIDYAEKNGKNFRDTDAQLGYFMTEFNNRNGLKSKLNATSNPQDAATVFLDGFEMYEGWHNKGATGRKQNTERRANAQAIYNTYHGTYSGKNTNYAGENKMVAMGSGLVGYDFTNPNNNFGSGSSSDSVIRRAPRMAGRASGTTDGNVAMIDEAIKYLKTIAENTTYNKLLSSIADILKQNLQITAKMNNANSSASGTAAEQDFTNGINNDISLLISKLDAISQAQ